MPGPAPKNPNTRQRRNKTSTNAILKTADGFIEGRPSLPDFPGEGDWHPLASAWWDTIWDSPMSGEFLWGDMPALLRTASLVDEFWRTHDLNVAKEIRLMEKEFGLTPMSRRRLQWQVVQTEEAKDRRSRQSRHVDPGGSDPREVLS